MTTLAAGVASPNVPHLLIAAEPGPGIRTVKDVQRATEEGFARQLWERLRVEAERELGSDPYLPTSEYPGRHRHSIAHGTRDFIIVDAVCRRLKNDALMWLLTEDDRFRHDALRQMGALFDPATWPGWVDQAHLLNADLRTGMLLRAFGYAYDWLRRGLSDGDRRWIIAELDRCAIQPYLAEVERGAWFTGTQRMNNWNSVVVGGAATAAMALGEAHPCSHVILHHGLNVMEAYSECLGPEGEFDESVAYAGSMQYLIEFFAAHRYHARSACRLSDRRFGDFCRWYMHFILPPGRVACFGDSHVEAPPRAVIFAAVASASRDGVLQWFYLNHTRPGPSDELALELLLFDPTVEPVSPEGRVPRGRAYHAHGAAWSSRTGWDPRSTPCVVYGKAGSGDECHGHHDAGQVCIDAWGERLIVDLGSPSGYPSDFFSANRWRYYNTGVVGHNVLMFGGREMRAGKEHRARVLGAAFDDGRGGWWRCDTSALYEGVVSVRRTVIHLHPAVVAVLDEATLDREEDISLRWHTRSACNPADDGSFVVAGNAVRLSARVIRLDGDVAFRRREHRYAPPFDRARLGAPLDARREPYVEARCRARACRILSLFAAFGADAVPARWEFCGDAWSIAAPLGPATAEVSDQVLRVSSGAPLREWRVLLRAGVTL